MAIKVLKFVNGIPKEINPSVDSIAAKSIFIGGAEGTGTELTKVILDALRGGGDASSLHNHDTQYYTKATTYTKSEINSLVGDVGSGLQLEIENREEADDDLGLRIDSAEDAIGLKASQSDLEQEIGNREQGDLDVAEAASTDATNKANAALAAAIADALATYVPLSQKGANSGVATLDSNGKILVSQLSALAITEVFVVADIAARDALVIGSSEGEIQEGDVAVVIDADGNGNKSSFIYTGSAWVSLNDGTVISVNGQTGSVVLSTSDIAEGSNLYYTQSRFNTAFANKSTSDLYEGSNLYFTESRAKSAVAADIASAVALEAQARTEADEDLDEKIDELIAQEVIDRNAAIGIEAAARVAGDAATLASAAVDATAKANAAQAAAAADATSKASNAQSASNSYTDASIAQEVIDRDDAIGIEAGLRVAGDAATLASAATDATAKANAAQAAAAADATSKASNAQSAAATDATTKADAAQAAAAADATSKVAAAKAEIMGGIPDSMFDTIKEIADELASDNTATGVILGRLNALESADSAQSTINSNLQSADATLQDNIDDADGYAQDIRNDLDSEIARATAAEGVNATSVETEAGLRVAGDAATLASAATDATAKANAAQAAAQAYADGQDVIAAAAAQAYADAAVLVEKNRAEAAEALKSDVYFSLPTAVEDIVVGDLIVAKYNGSSQVEAYKASSAAADNADFNNGKWAVVGSAFNATSNAVHTVSIKKAVGDIATVSFDSAPTLADAGKSVYLGSNGKATLTAPSDAGAGITYIGTLASATQVFLCPAQLRGINADA